MDNNNDTREIAEIVENAEEDWMVGRHLTRRRGDAEAQRGFIQRCRGSACSLRSRRSVRFRLGKRAFLSVLWPLDFGLRPLRRTGSRVTCWLGQRSTIEESPGARVAC